MSAPLVRGISRVRKRMKMPSFNHQLLMQHDTHHAVGGTTVQGRRFTNEDLLHVNFTPSHKMFAVLDGHNGVRAATFVKKRLQQMFAQHYVPGTSESVGAALQKTFEQIERELSVVQETSGTCVAAAVLTSSSLCVANVGDSRIILTGAAGVIPLTTEHRPGDSLERERIEQNGGKVVRVAYSVDDPGIDRIYPGGLAVSRVLGGAQHKKHVGIVSSVPDISCATTDAFGSGEENCLMILASDGIWDVMTNEEVAKLAQTNIESTMTLHTLLFEQERASPSAVTTVRSRDESKYTVGQLVDLPLAKVTGFVQSIETGQLHVREIPKSLVPYLTNGEDASGALMAWSLSVACQNIVDECLRRGSGDNLSMLCVKQN